MHARPGDSGGVHLIVLLDMYGLRCGVGDIGTWDDKRWMNAVNGKVKD